MKKVYNFLMIIFFVALTFSSCNNSDEYTYEGLAPVYMSLENFRQSPEFCFPQNIKQSGKIYFKDNLIFVNEVNEGIHIIDNANPAAPRKIGFLEILGNVDMAIRGNILFADSYIDLIALDISNIQNPVEVGRIENAFPHVMPMVTDANLPMLYYEFDSSKGVIVGWEKKTVKGYHSGGPVFWWGPNIDIAYDAARGGESASGIGGSMARFMLNDSYLYSVAQPNLLKTIDISTPADMKATDSIYTWREMETIFKYKQNLFVGTTTGMVIYNIEVPSKPEFVSELNHINSCDPVVVENDIAYVTLRSGTVCMNTTNQLDVIDVSDLSSPKLLKSYPMFNPYGLGIDEGKLFICDGAAGLKVYDASNPLAIQSNQIAHFPGIDTYDVIPLGDILILIGQDGLYQYDYSDASKITLLSHIKVGK